MLRKTWKSGEKRFLNRNFLFARWKQKLCYEILQSQQMTSKIIARPIRHPNKKRSTNKEYDDDDTMETEPVVHDCELETR